jgi:hypothetical protein
VSVRTRPAPGTCAACERGWDNYIRAVTARLKVVARRHKAVLRNDTADLEEIERIEAGLVDRELRARRAIAEHEATH